MKLSDYRGEQAVEVIALLIDPVANIAEDEQAKELLTRRKPPEGTDPTKYAISRLRAALPTLLKSHKADIIAILAAVNGMDPADYGKQAGMTTIMRDFAALISDKEFVEFFIAAQPTTADG